MSDERVELERVSPREEAPLVQPGYPRMPAYPESAAYGYGNAHIEDEEDSIHLREIWRIIRKRRWLIITVAVIITTLVTIEAYRAKSTYKASAFIEIGKETPTVRSGASGMAILADDDLYYPQLSINTNLFRLTSEPLLEDVVADLKLDQNPKFSEPTQRTFWEAVQAVFNRATFKKPEPEPLTTVGGLISGPDKQSRSPEEHERLAPFVSMVAGGLQAEQVKETRTLKVTFTHTDPVICAAVANGVAQDFIDQNFETKTERFTSASKWLDTTTRELMAKVERAEQDLTDYTKAHNIFATEGKETLTTDKLSRLHDQATRTETDRILKQSVFEVVKAGRMSELPAAFSDPKITTLQTKLDELRAKLEQLSLKYGQEHPQIIEAKLQIKIIEGQLDSSRKALEDKLKGEYELAARDEASLNASLERAKGEAVKQNQDAIQYNILKTEVDTAKSMYTEFLNKTNQAKVEVAQQHNNMRLIQPARIPGTPVGPGRFRSIVIGLFLSLIGGVGLAYFLEYLDNTIKTVEDVSRYVQLPALGVIPALASAATRRMNGGRRVRNLIVGRETSSEPRNFPLASDSLTVFDNRSSAAEAYRVVRTSMLLSAPGSPPKTILITSGQAGEGKTTTVVNTAISLAQLGSSVLIIDCDLRKPATHKIFGVNPEHGLSSYLSNYVEIDGLIQKLQIPNLSLLPCGSIPPNPAELISSARMKDLIKLMAGRYDHILIDSPPLINVTDPVILSTLVDGVIMVIHGGKSPRAVVQRARQELLGVGAKIFGVVLNNIDMTREGYDAYYYYYNRYYMPYEKDGRQPTADR